MDRILSDKYWRVDPILNLVPYNRTMNALEFLCYSSEQFEVSPVMAKLIGSLNNSLVPQVSSETVIPEVNFKIEQENCNDSQKKAIKSAMTNEISLIQGPPGTGKTKTASLIIKYWIELGYYPILCVAETNEAVNNLCLSLIEKGLSNHVVRIGSSGVLPDSVKAISLEEIYRQHFNTERMHEDFWTARK